MNAPGLAWDVRKLKSQAFRAGAAGYLLKSSAGEELITAIHEVAAVRTYVAPAIAKDLIHSLLNGGDHSGVTQLTVRQRQVLQLIAEGKTMKEIAGILKISARTAESHKYDMMHALGMVFRVPARDGMPVAAVDQQPLLLRTVGPAHTQHDERALEVAPFQEWCPSAFRSAKRPNDEPETEDGDEQRKAGVA